MKIEIFAKAIKESNVALVEQGLKESPKLANQVYEGFLLFQTAVYQLKMKGKENSAAYQKLLDQRLNIIVLMIKHGAQSLVIYDELGFNIFQMALYRACYLYNDKEFESASAHLATASTIYEEAKSKNDRAALARIQASVDDMLVTGNGKLEGKKHTLFHMAVYFGYSMAVDLILKIEPKATLVNEFGLSALHLSILAYAHHTKLDEKSDSKQLAERKKERAQIVHSILDFLTRDPSTGYQNLITYPWKGTWPVINDPIIISTKYKATVDETPMNSATNLRCIELVDLLNKYQVKLASASDSSLQSGQAVRGSNVSSTSSGAVASSSAELVQRAICVDGPIRQQVVTVVQDFTPTVNAIPALHVGGEMASQQLNSPATSTDKKFEDPALATGSTDSTLFSDFLNRKPLRTPRSQ